MNNLTTVPGQPSKSDAKPGMAYFAGTGPSGKFCGDCKYRGYYRKSGNGNDYRVTSCAMFKKLGAGTHGPGVKAEYRSCKYFKQKPK